MSNLRPRRCVLEKGSDGYGFHLHGEKGKTGQFIRLVEPDTPAEVAGLMAGDRLAFVNGESVEGESHSQVVARIRASHGSLELIVTDQETLELLQRHNLTCKAEYVTEGIPVPGASSSGGGGDSDAEQADTNGSRRTSSPAPLHENGERISQRSSVSSKEEKSGLRPRLCHLKKGSGGYGFNLHSEKSRPGQFIRAVDDDSPAQKAGLKPSDKIVQVNGVPMAGKQHADVVAAIKASGDEVRLLVVDTEADLFFSQCNVLPTEEHLSGPLPQPRVEQAPEEEQPAAEERKAKTSVSSESSASSHTSQPGPSAMTTREEPASDSLGFGLSVAQARERAQQKRLAKNPPRMDWNKRNEVFSNL
ncbi:Na(+)/H(+) exchange regulatory cofactor NHE-RF1-like [Eucyclogobius newberryi]|uniref:Na(+)/H(+) exchange regulatory cofactor NHE-RF1-like n=1 Tax=Eucyclogobius newberryi TaxID=166745 RepID=UPI003B58E1E8